MQAHQKRVVEEREELLEKLGKLNTFLDSEKSLSIPEAELQRLQLQQKIMIQYADILDERIRNF